MKKDLSKSKQKLNFLIIQTAWLGDAILALPLAQELRRRHPGAIIHFLVRKGNEGIAQNHPAVNQVWTWDKKKKKYLNLLRLIISLRKIHFTGIYNCQRYASSGFFTALLNAQEKAGFDKNPFRFFFTRTVQHKIAETGQGIIHETDRNLSLLEGDSTERRPKLFPGENDKKKTITIRENGPYIVIAPGSAWFTKQLPMTIWKAFIKALPLNLNIVLVGSEKESKDADELAKEHRGVTNECGKLSQLESAALMGGALRVFVNDSGALHLASGVNAPVTAIFCSTVPRFGFGPLSDDSIIIETSESLVCRPCGLTGKAACPEGHFLCGNSILANNILSTLHLPPKS